MVLAELMKKPNPHPSKEIFVKFKVPAINVARAIDRSYNHTLAILNGNVKATHEIDEHLRLLARQLEKEAGEGGAS